MSHPTTHTDHPMTTDSPKHSPTPWTIGQDKKVLDANGEPVTWDKFHTACVRCINSHDALVGALECALDDLCDFGDAGDHDTVQKIRAALALAKEIK